MPAMGRGRVDGDVSLAGCRRCCVCLRGDGGGGDTATHGSRAID